MFTLKWGEFGNSQLLTGSTSEVIIIDLVSNFDYVEFYSVSDWYRKLFDTEKAVPPKKNQFLYGKGGTNNKFNLLQYRSYRN